jgi:hypothetical protein
MSRTRGDGAVALGEPVARERTRDALTAEEHARLAGVAAQMTRNFRAAASSARRLEQVLIELEPLGYTLMSDRRWPASHRADIDFVLVGPGGVFLVDARSWSDVEVQGGRVWRDRVDVTEQLASFADLAYLTRAELAEVGLPAGEVRAIVAFTDQPGLRGDVYDVELRGERDAVLAIARSGRRLSPPQVAEVRGVLERLFPPMVTGPIGIVDTHAAALPVSLTAPAVESIPITATLEVLGSDEVLAALRDGLETEPIETWMSFLHPAQARVVRRAFSGPSRVRGAAGTGKTVVALHRAAHLARETGGRVLFTSFSRTLPRVLSTLLARLAPDVAGRVDFRSVHAFAYELLRERDIDLVADAQAADRIFLELWQAGLETSPLAALDPGARYWREEISAVLKGRGLTEFDDYAHLARIGRRRPLSLEQRRAVWALYLAYETALNEAGIGDFADLILEAEATLADEPLDRYTAVVVDEAQDLSCAMVRMLHALVGDRADGLHLVGDGQQSIYPGGYTLAEAGVSVQGRSVVLGTNYRNTAEIVEVASALIEHDEFADIEGGTARAETAQVLRVGAVPVIETFATRDEHDEMLVTRVELLLDDGVRRRDIGVLALTNWHAREAASALETVGIPTVLLDDDDGGPTDAVRVGTVKRAKGLEFGQVLLARTPASLIDPTAVMSLGLDDAAQELRGLQLRELYVAMTRARDGLWVGVA